MNANSANGKQSCPVCGEKKQERHLVCRNCFSRYQMEAAQAILQGKILTLQKWARPKITARLADLQQELKKKQAEYAALQEQTKSEAYQAITEVLDGKYVDHRVFCQALKQKSREIWQANNGNKLHYELRTLEAQITTLEGIVEGLEDKLEQDQEESCEDEGDETSPAEESSTSN